MEGKSWVVEVLDNKASNLLEIIEAEKKDWEKHSIYKLPACVTDEKTDNYKPRAISFGPYHYGDPNLNPMESHKERALLRFLKRSGKSLNYCIEMVNDVGKDLMDAYDSLDSGWRENPAAFVELMVRDGCFMLELLRPSWDCWFYHGEGGRTVKGYAEKDPIFSNHGKWYLMPYIKRDMLMLENQLPMLLLTKLLSVEDQAAPPAQLNIQAESKDDCVNELIVKFFFPNKTETMKLGQCKHVLDVYRKVLILVADYDRRVVQFIPEIYYEGTRDILPSVSELHEAGITIKKSKTKSIRDISFHGGLCRGVLSLPEITVDDTTGAVFLNLMAFERFHVGIGNEVTSYVALMDDIIDNAKDVNLLKSKEILKNAFGSDKYVAELFNGLSEDIAIDPGNVLFDVRKAVKKYSKRRLNRWRGNLMRNYLNNPWSSIALIAAVLAFGLSIIQTIYTAGQFYQGKVQK